MSKYQTLELKYEETLDDVAKEYIAAMKYHAGQGLLTMTELSEIYYELVDYLRTKEKWDN